jgi:hypothetical protein
MKVENSLPSTTDLLLVHLEGISILHIKLSQNALVIES